MLKFIDDLAGGIYDVLSLLLKGFSYFIAGVMIVGAPLYLIAWIFEVIAQ